MRGKPILQPVMKLLNDSVFFHAVQCGKTQRYQQEMLDILEASSKEKFKIHSLGYDGAAELRQFRLKTMTICHNRAGKAGAQAGNEAKIIFFSSKRPKKLNSDIVSRLFIKDEADV